MLHIGFNARLFPANWRPVLDEIAFAAQSGLRSMQFIGKENGLTPELLGGELDTVANALRAADLMPVMEINLALRHDGRTASGAQPLDILYANVPAITTLGISAVHWHCTLADESLAEATLRDLETSLTSQMAQGVALGNEHGFRFGFEHNAPDLRLFAAPADCAKMLDSVSGLGFVWDFNHTQPADLAGFKALAPRLSLLHISDTPLPETNYHLPLGMGNVDFADYCATVQHAGFSGAAILEIGGLPKSGGYGRDTDAALHDSRQHLETVLASV